MAGVVWLSLLLCVSSYWIYSPYDLEQFRNTEVQPLNAGERAVYTFSLRYHQLTQTSILTVEFPRLSYAPSALAAVTCVLNAQPAACKSVDSKVLVSVPAGKYEVLDFTLAIAGVLNPAVYPKGTGIFRAWTGQAEQALPDSANYAMEAVGLMPAAALAFCYDALHVQTTEVQEKTALSFTLTQLVDIPAGSLIQITFPAEFTLQQGALPCNIWGQQVDCTAQGQVVEALGTPFDISQENAATNYLNVTIWGVTNPAYALPAKALSFTVKVWDSRHRYIYGQCSALSGNITAGAVTIYEAKYALDVVQPVYGGWSVVDITFAAKHSVPANGYLYVRLNNPVYNEWYDSTPSTDIGAAPSSTIDYCCVKLGLSKCQANCRRMRTDFEQYHYELLIDGATVDLKAENITLRVMMELWYEPVVGEIQIRTKDHRVVDSTFLTPDLAIPQVSASAYSSDSFINRANNYLSFDGVTPESGSEYSKFKFAFTSTTLLKTNARITATLNTAPSYFRVTGPPEACTGTFVSLSTSDPNMCGIVNGNQLFLSFPSNMIAGANSVTWSFGTFYRLLTPLMATGQCIFHIVHIEMSDESGNVVYQTNYPLFLYTKFVLDPYRVVAPWNADLVASGNGRLTQWRLKFKPTIAVPYSQGTGTSKIRFTCDSFVTGIQDVRGNAVALGSKVQSFAYLGYTDTAQVSIVLDKGSVNHADGRKPNSGFGFTVTTPEILKTETCYELSVLAGGPTVTDGFERTIQCAAEYSYTIGCEDYKVETHSSVDTTTFANKNSLSYRTASSGTNTWTDLSVYLQSSTAVSALTNITLKGSVDGADQDNPAWMSCWLPSSWRFTANSTMLLDGYILGNVTVVNDWATVISGRTWGDATLNTGDFAYITLTNVLTPACAADGGTKDPIACYYGTYSRPSKGYGLINGLAVNQLHRVLNVALSPEWGTQGQTDAAYNVSFALDYSVQSGAQILIRISSHLGDSGLYFTAQGMCTVNVPATCTYTAHVFNITLRDNTAAGDTLIVGFSGLHNPIVSTAAAACDVVVVASIKVVDHCVNSYSGQALNMPQFCLLQPEKPADLQITAIDLWPAYPELMPSEVEVSFMVSPALRPGTRLNLTFPTGSIAFSSCALFNDGSAQCQQVAPNMIEIQTTKAVFDDVLFLQHLTTSSSFSSQPFSLTATYAGNVITSYKYYRPVQATTFTPHYFSALAAKPIGAVQSPISSDFRVKVWPTRTEGEIVQLTFTFTPRVALTSAHFIILELPSVYGASLPTSEQTGIVIPCESLSLETIRLCRIHMRQVFVNVGTGKVYPPYTEHVVTIRNLRNPPATGASSGPFQLFILNRATSELLDYDQFSPLGEYFFQGQPQALIFNPVALSSSQGRLISPERSMNFTISSSNLYVGHTANYTFEFSANHAFNFSVVGSASCVGVQFPRDYELNNFVQALLPLPEMVVPERRSDFDRDLLPLSCLLTVWGNASYWATCHYYENHVFLFSPPKGLLQLEIRSMRNPAVAGQTSAFVLKIYENFYNDYSVKLHDAGGQDTNITFQTYPSLSDYTLTFSADSPAGNPHVSNKEEIVALAKQVTMNPGTQLPCALKTYSGLPNFAELLTFRPIVLGSNLQPTSQVTLNADTWVWQYADFTLDFDIVVSTNVLADTYTVYWLMQEDFWSSTIMLLSPTFLPKARSNYNISIDYVPPAPLRIQVSKDSPATIAVVGEVGTLAPGSVRGHVQLAASVAPSTPLTVSFTPSTAGVTVSPASLVLVAGQTTAQIAISVAASETLNSASVRIDLSGASADFFTATAFSFAIKQVRDGDYSASVTLVEKHKTWVNLAVSSAVQGVLRWAAAVEGTPAPLPVEIMTGTQSFSTTSSYTTHLSEMAYGQTAIMVQTQLKVGNLRAETKYVLYTYVQTDQGTVGPLGQYSFSTLNK